MSDSNTHPLYPLFLRLAGCKVVVIGGGPVAQRKVHALLDAGAVVTLIAPTITDDLAALAQQNKINCLRRTYQPGDLTGATLVFVACGDDRVNREIFDEASRLGIFCNVADVPQYCSFFVPAVVQRGPLQIAVSTGGASPALAKRIRRQLESLFDDSYTTYLDALARLRRHLRRHYPDDQHRRATILEAFLDSDALDSLRRGAIDQFEKRLNEFLKRDHNI